MLTNIARKIRRKLFPPREAIEGYENDELVETIFRKTIAYEPSGEWPLVEGVKSVLDFGGGCGLHYKIARRQAPNIHWAVVETPSMVLRARELATDKLAFFRSYRQILVTAEPVRRRRLWADGQPVWQ